jgi:hypothetical protein
MISPSCHQPYIAAVANACGCTQGPLPWRIILVALGNCPGWPGEFQGSRIEAIQNLPDVRFFFLPLLTYVSKTRIQRCLCREVDGIWQYRTGGNLTIFDKDHDAAEEGRSQAEAFATIAMYSWWQLGEIECVPNSKSAEGGGEAGHAHGCKINSLSAYNSSLVSL